MLLRPLIPLLRADYHKLLGDTMAGSEDEAEDI